MIAPGTRVSFFQRHRGLTPDTTGVGVFVERVGEVVENWVVVDDSGRRWALILEFGDTLEAIADG